jgi:hypothetical protein
MAQKRDFVSDLKVNPNLIIERAGGSLAIEVPGRDVLRLLSGDLRPGMIEALRRVKAKFKTGRITNNLPAKQRGGGRCTSPR